MKRRPPVGLTSGHRLARNVLWNILGTGVPLLGAIIAIPILIEGLGTERFGVLTLAWMVVGYFSLFDMGLGRALTKLVAERLGSGRQKELPVIVGTSMFLMAVLGMIGAFVFWGISPWLVESALKIPKSLRSEMLQAFYLLAASIPIVISTTGLRGILEAHQAFRLVNAVRIPLGVMTFLGPLAVLPFSNSLFPIVGILLVVRVVAWIAYILLCLRVAPALHRAFSVKRTMIRQLLSFGGWMTVTNIVGPLMVYMDRFFIGSMVSIVAVAYYATPYEVITKIWIIPGALMGVLFPAFAAALVADRLRATYLYKRSIYYIFFSVFPLTLIGVVYADDGLTLWLGDEFSNNSTPVLIVLSVGILLNSLARAPIGLIQGSGRPDLPAKLHLAELPLYVLALWWLLTVHGIVGAAIAWTLRVAIDSVALFVIAERILAAGILLRLTMTVVCALSVMAFGFFITGLIYKFLFLLAVLCALGLIFWYWFIEDSERALIDRLVRKTRFLHE